MNMLSQFLYGSKRYLPLVMVLVCFWGERSWGQVSGATETADRYGQFVPSAGVPPAAAPPAQYPTTSYPQAPVQTAYPSSTPSGYGLPPTYYAAQAIPTAPGPSAPVLPVSHPVLAPPAASVPEADVAPVSKPAKEEVIAPEAVAENDVDYWYEPGYWFPDKIWSGGAEIGLSGSEGNAQSFSMRAGLNAKRETDRWINAVDWIYNRANANGVPTAHNSLLTVNNDLKLGDSPWTGFVNVIFEYDEFRAFDLRVAVNGGVGFQFIKTDCASLIGRFGSGASTEIGAVDEEWVPEAVFGMEYEHQLSERQKVSLKVDYFPEWTDYENYRMLTDASWEMLLHEASNMSLKISAIDRYDSTPGTARPNDIDYALLLLWKL